MRGAAGRFALGCAWGAALAALQPLLAKLPLLAHLELLPVAAFAALAVFGWTGFAGAASGWSLVLLLRGGDPGGLRMVLIAVAASVLGWAVLRAVPGFQPSLAGRRELGVFGLGALATALTYATAASALHLPDRLGKALAIWLPSAAASLLLFAPPLLLAGAGPLRRWAVAWPGEEPDRWRASQGSPEPSPVQPRPWVDALVTAAALAAVSCAIAGLAQAFPAIAIWLALLYVAPIYWLARRHQVAGGLLAAAAVGVCYLLALSRGRAVDLASHVHAVEASGLLLLFWLLGAVIGAGERREAALKERLAESNRRLRRELELAVRALTSAVEAKDAYTEGHLQRVTEYAGEVALRLGLAGREVERVRIASSLHDVGKIGIPEQVLRKPGPLDSDERALILRHPEIGARILADIDGLGDAATLVLHHQERWDGRQDGPFPGYPAGLAGEAIPLGARIIAVVDAFDAMTTDRSYRARRSVGEAVAVLRQERGAQFDPRVVDAFVEVLGERPWGGN